MSRFQVDFVSLTGYEILQLFNQYIRPVTWAVFQAVTKQDYNLSNFKDYLKALSYTCSLK